MLLYRLNRVTAANILSFLKLLNGTNWHPFEEGERKLTDEEKEQIANRLKQLSAADLAQLIAQQLPKTVLKLRRLERAVSCSDFETLALEADPRVERAHCLPRRDMDVDPEQEKPGHVSVIILPRAEIKSFGTGARTAVRADCGRRKLSDAEAAADNATTRRRTTIFNSGNSSHRRPPAR